MNDNYVAIELKDLEEKKVGGIIVMAKSDDETPTGKVLEVGPKVTDITQGDTVLYVKGSGQEINVHGKKVLVIRETEILAVMG